jgi:hypothetical protein
MVIPMERALEANVRVEASPEFVAETLSNDPAGMLTGMPSPDTVAFLAEIAVDLGGGTTVAHEVDMAFARLSEDGPVRRFSLSWRAHDHQGALPAFHGDLKIHQEGNGSRLQVSGRYSVPLGPVGGFGDLLLGHRIACRSVQAFLEAAGARIDAALAQRDSSRSAAGIAPEDVTITVDDLHPELYLG